MVDITLILRIETGNLYRGDVHNVIWKKDILILWMSFQVNLFA